VLSVIHDIPSVLWRRWLVVRKGIQPVKIEWWGAGVVICLERGADLHMAQLMPLPLTVSCSSKLQISFTFLVPAHLGSPGKRAVKRVCVCVCDTRMILVVCYIMIEWPRKRERERLHICCRHSVMSTHRSSGELRGREWVSECVFVCRMWSWLWLRGSWAKSTSPESSQSRRSSRAAPPPPPLQDRRQTDVINTVQPCDCCISCTSNVHCSCNLCPACKL